MTKQIYDRKTHVLGMRVTPDLRQRIDMMCEQLGVSKTDLMDLAITHFQDSAPFFHQSQNHLRKLQSYLTLSTGDLSNGTTQHRRN